VRAITLQRPWLYAILHLGKDVENRSWNLPAWLDGLRIALHDGLVWDAAGAEWIENELGIVLPASLQHAPGGVIGATTRVRRERPTDEPSRWAADGAQHWRLSETRAVNPPVPHRGAQGLWEVEEEALDEVLDREVRRAEGSTAP
jgi:hypothetical protein